MCIMDIKIKQNPYFLKQGFCQVTIFFVTLHYISQIIVAKLHFFAKYTNLFCCCIFLCLALVLWWNGRGKKTTCCRRGKRGKDVSLSTAAGAGNRDQKNAHPASGMGVGGRLWAYNWSAADTIRTLCGRVNNLVLAQEEISTKVAIIKTKDRTITTPCRWFPMSRES